MPDLDTFSFVWPLLAVLILLFIIRQVRDDLRPVTRAVGVGLSAHAQRYALAYALAALYGAAASLQALADVATQLGWIYVAGAAKVIQPGAVAVIAFINKAPVVSDSKAKEPTP